MESIKEYSPVAEEQFERENVAGFGSSAINLLKTLIGAGMLALPWAFSSIGLVPGILMLLIAAFASVVGVHLLVLASDKIIAMGLAKRSNFAELAKPTYPKASKLFEFAVALKCCLIAASYLTVVGDVVPNLIMGVVNDAHPILVSRFFWVSMLTLFISPVTFLEQMDSLKYTSFIGLLGVLYLFSLSFLMFFGVLGVDNSVGDSFGRIELFVPISFKAIQSFSVFVFAFTCHQNIFPIHTEIKENKPRVMLKLVCICICISLFIYTLFATLFYGVFGSNVETNVIRNFPVQGFAFVAARLLYAFLMIFSYPIMTFPTRSSIIKMLGSFETSKSPKKRIIIHSIVNFGILIVTWGIAAIHVPLGFLLTLVGSTAGPVICYFLPAMFWWKLDAKDRDSGKGRIICISLFIFGIFATVIPLTSLIVTTIQK